MTDLTRAAGLVALLVASGCGGEDGMADAGASDASLQFDSGEQVDASGVADAGDSGGSEAGVSDAGDLDGAVDAGAADAGVEADASLGADAGGDGGAVDAGPTDASADAASADAGASRQVLFPGFCSSVATSPGLYRGTLASNLNDVASVSGCGVLSVPGRDGSVRVELDPGQTVRAVLRHGGDGALYILDSCPVISSCLAGADDSFSGEETVEWTNSGSSTNPVYVFLDSDSPSGPQTFELDLAIIDP